MKSTIVSTGQVGPASQYNSLRDDARGAASFVAHQQLGALALPTNPSNGQTWTLTINGSAVSGAFVSSIGATAGNVLIGASAAATAANLLALLQSPQATTANGIALLVVNQKLLSFCGYTLNGTTITIFSFNGGLSVPLSSFTASTTATGGSWTANTMKLYIESGIFYVGITQVVFAGGSTAAFTAPTSHPRIDIVTIDSTGTLLITQGTESVSPVAPTYPTGKLVICEVTNVVGETAIYDNQNQQSGQGFISKDARGFTSVFYIADNSQIAPGVIQATNLANAGTCATASIVMFAATSAPAGWLMCDGSAVSRTTYATLFAAISTTYGIGDGSTTFNLPNLQGNVPVGYKSGDADFGTLGQTAGEKTHLLTTTEMPAHTHSVAYGSGGPVGLSNAGTAGGGSVTTGSAGSGGAHNNLQPYLALNFIIKT
jgi:microcystin-dependent protein